MDFGPYCTHLIISIYVSTVFPSLAVSCVNWTLLINFGRSKRDIP